MTKWNIVPVAFAAAALFVAAPAQAQVAFGPQVSFGTESDLGVGGRVELPVGGMITQDAESVMAGLKLIGSFDYYFWDEEGCDQDGVSCSWMDINANGAVPIPLEGFSPYVGAGLNIAMVSVSFDDCPAGFDCDTSETETGINVLGGLNFPLGGLAAFAEGRLVLSGEADQFAITAGILF